MLRILVLALVAFALGVLVGRVLVPSPDAAGPAGRTGLAMGAAPGAETPGGTGTPRGEAPGPAGGPEATEAGLPSPAPARPAVGETPANPASAPAAGAAPSGRISWDGARLREVIRESLRKEFRERAEREIPDGMLEEETGRIAAEVERVLPGTPERWGRSGGARLAERELLRDRVGTLEDPVEVLLQVRGNGSEELSMVPLPERLRTRSLAAEPLDLESPVSSRERMAVFARTGVLPRGKALVVEGVELTARPMVESSRSPLRVEFALAGNELLPRADFVVPARLAWKGAALLRAGQEESTVLKMREGAAGVRIRGRLIPEAAVASFPARALELVPEECRGFLAGGRVVLQILSDGGGGNRRRLHLDGTTNGYLGGTSPEDLSPRAYASERLRVDLGHAEGAALIPPGKRLAVLRVDVRGRFLPGGRKNGRVEVGVSGRTIFQEMWDEDRTAPDFAATWTEGATVEPGREDRVFVETDTAAFVEAVLTIEVK